MPADHIDIDSAAIEFAHIRSLLHLPGARLLDVGCGTGMQTRWLARDAAFTVGLDSDHDDVVFAASGRPDVPHGGIAWLTAAGQRLPFASQSFDHVLFSWSL